MGKANYDEAAPFISSFKYGFKKFNFYFKDMNRDQAENILKDEADGTFLLRDSSIKKGVYLVISVVKDKSVQHQLVCHDSGLMKPAEGSIVITGDYVNFFRNNKILTNPFTQDDYKMKLKMKKGLKETVLNASVDSLMDQMPNENPKPPKEIRQHIASFLGGNDVSKIATANKVTAKAVRKATNDKKEEQEREQEQERKESRDSQFSKK